MAPAKEVNNLEHVLMENKVMELKEAAFGLNKACGIGHDRLRVPLSGVAG